MTSNETDKLPPSDPDASDPTPGERIRTARERTGLTLEKLALQLRLDLSTVEALEADAYDRLTAPLFARGYLRNIAKVLDLDETRLLERYDRLIADDAPPELARVSRPEDASPVTGRAIQIGSAAVAVLTLVLAFAWWQSEQGTDDPVAVVPQPESEPAAPIPEPTPSPRATDRFGIDDLGDATLGFAPQAGEEPARDFDGEVVTSPIADEDAKTEGAAGVDRATDAGTLTLTPEADAWIEVTDASGRRLYYATAPGGEQIALDGEPPFDLIIGNAEYVRLRYRGREVPLDEISNAGVARLTVGDDAGPR